MHPRAGQGVQAKVSAALSPLIGLLGQDRADEPNDCVSVGEGTQGVGAAADPAVEPLVVVVGPDLLPEPSRELREGEDVCSGGNEVAKRVGEFVLDAVE